MAEIESPPIAVRADSKYHPGDSDESSLVKAVAERTPLQDQLYLRYRRPLLQVFHHRRIDRDDAEELLQRTFEISITKIRAVGLADPDNLGGYLYRTASNLATAYWRGELGLSRRYERNPEALENLADDALALDERVSREQLATWVRELMECLERPRDREVLERFYLHVRGTRVCRSMLGAAAIGELLPLRVRPHCGFSIDILNGG